MPDFSPADFRAQFPVFSHVPNQSLVYLDNAATTQKPRAMIQAISAYYSQTHANAHRASHRLARQATELVEETRRLSADFLGTSSPRGVVFTRGATEGLNLLASSLGEALKAGDEILLTTAEHHANLVPWQRVAEQTGAQLRFLPEVDGEPNWDALADCLTERTRVFSMTAASNVLGFQAPLTAIRQCLQQHAQQHAQQHPAVAWVLDGAQWAAHLPVNIDDWGCDYFVCSAHKCFGPTGLGLLWGKPERLDELPPWQSGGEMITRVHLTHSEYAEAPHRFEPGTASLSAIAAWNAVLKLRHQWPLLDMRRHEQNLIVYLHERLQAIPDLRLLSKTESAQGLSNVGVATFVIDNADAHASDLAHWLDDADIAVRSGHLCAQPLLQTLGVSQVTRISLAPYNTQEDVDCCCRAIEQFVVAAKEQGLSQQPRYQPARLAKSSQSPTSADLFVNQNLDGGVAARFVCADLTELSLDVLHALPMGQARLKQLTRWGKQLSKQADLRLESYRVEGCESNVWMAVWPATEEEYAFWGAWAVAIDTDSNVLKGLAVALLIAVKETYSEALNAPLCVMQWDEKALADTLTAIGLQQFLTPSRANGFWAIFRHLRATLAEKMRLTVDSCQTKILD